RHPPGSRDGHLPDRIGQRLNVSRRNPCPSGATNDKDPSVSPRLPLSRARERGAGGEGYVNAAYFAGWSVLITRPAEPRCHNDGAAYGLFASGQPFQSVWLTGRIRYHWIVGMSGRF